MTPCIGGTCSYCAVVDKISIQVNISLFQNDQLLGSNESY